MNVIKRIKVIEKKIKERQSFEDKGIPIIEVSEEVKDKYRKMGLPIPIMGGLSSLK